jgi:uncharacterized membrane protein YeaQ/YmgE (transglycosylase-associated protein family)
MELSEILSIVTFVVTLICGVITKRIPKISNKIIPIQNLVIGIIVAIIEWIITKDFSTAIMLSGVLAGGTYDILHNLEKLRGE